MSSARMIAGSATGLAISASWDVRAGQFPAAPGRLQGAPGKPAPPVTLRTRRAYPALPLAGAASSLPIAHLGAQGKSARTGLARKLASPLGGEGSPRTRRWLTSRENRAS